MPFTPEIVSWRQSPLLCTLPSAPQAAIWPLSSILENTSPPPFLCVAGGDDLAVILDLGGYIPFLCVPGPRHPFCALQVAAT